MSRYRSSRLLPLTLMMACVLARAEVPAFDRPGIAFSTAALKPGSLSIEQGLPDIVRDSDGGEKTTLYSANTLLRIGLIPSTEIQIGTALLNRLETRNASGEQASGGHGDSSIALKVELPSAAESFSWAVLGGIGLDTGEAAFTAGATQYSLGLTGSWDIADSMALALYADADRIDGRNSWTVSPSLSFGLSEKLAAYVEAGSNRSDRRQDSVAGGGFTWMPTPRIQLDAYADAGLTHASTALIAGVGVSLYFDSVF